MNEQGIGPVNCPPQLQKGDVVHYKEGWMRVTAVFKTHVNLGPIFGGRGRFSGIIKRIPLSEVYEDHDAWYRYWETTESYQCM